MIYLFSSERGNPMSFNMNKINKLKNGNTNGGMIKNLWEKKKCYFLLFQQCFKRVLSLGSLEVWIVWLTPSHTMTLFNTPGKQAF